MREVQAAEAGARLVELLGAVERGESIAIARHGKTIAHLVPALAQGRHECSLAVERFLELRAQWGRTGMTRDQILSARHEGHRW